MKFYSHHIGDFDKKTRHLTRLERSVYRDMLDLYYDSEMPLSADKEVICRKIVARGADERAAVAQVLDEFFLLGDDGWHNSRCDEEIAAYRAKIDQAKRAAAASLQARQRANNGRSTDVQRIVEPTTNHEPITNSGGESSAREPRGKPDEVAEAFDAWNALAAETGLSKAQRLTPQRRAAIGKRLSECGGLQGWETALAKIRGSPFCNGANSNGWRADLDFILQPSSFTRLMEGRYDAKQPKPSGADQRKPTRADAFAAFDAKLAAAVARADHGSAERGPAPVVELPRIREGTG